tara:strand:+ start:15971 stop:17209 length:1239 start_codon:yes stop_codon:yes gene_type:complete
MKPLIKPFSALRPNNSNAPLVVAPPYDVINRKEALSIAKDKPSNFLHISRPEIDFPLDVDPYSEKVYEKGKENLSKLINSGVLHKKDSPSYYVYSIRSKNHEQTGLAAIASVEAYNSNRIKKHELTKPLKENDRIKNIISLNAQTGPVLCSYKADNNIKNIYELIKKDRPIINVKDLYGISHIIWKIDTEVFINKISSYFNLMDSIYIADGHHRSAAASKVSKEIENKGSLNNFFLAVLFPHNELQIIDYNRVVKDLNKYNPGELLDKIREYFILEQTNRIQKPSSKNTFGMYLDSKWYSLSIKKNFIPEDPVSKLDVSLLQNYILGPILGIDDPRTNSRIDFVGGNRGVEELVSRVDSGEDKIAFALFPTSMEDLMSVADLGLLMPPKSTWFEPKLADGLLSHTFFNINAQ